MTLFDQFQDITKFDEPLAPHTWLNVGGPAQMYVEPRTEEELQQLIVAAAEEDVPIRLLGGGSNLLVRDDGVSGVVIKLDETLFGTVTIEGDVVRSGGAAPLSSVITASISAGLGGLENLVGIPGTVGGAIKGNAGGRALSGM